MKNGVRSAWQQVYAGPVNLPPLLHDADESPLAARSRWQKSLAEQIYGPYPAPPEAMTCTRQRLPHDHVERLILDMQLPGGSFSVDAALWLPPGEIPRPLLCGLDFVGPVGILADDSFPLDSNARIIPRPEFGAADGNLADVLRGTSALSWPVKLLTDAGFAVLVSCYGSWSPDDPEACLAYGVKPLIDADTGALALWAWSISRLIDAAVSLPEIDSKRITVAGHSRLGKAALWAAANDRRISTTFASSSGTAGAAPTRHKVGETLSQLIARFPHWLHAKDPCLLPSTDQHALLALACPGALYLAAASDDVWADPVGSYLALVSASTMWPDCASHLWPDPQQVWLDNPVVVNRPLGFHLRPGGHALLPYDWLHFVSFCRNALASKPC